MKILTDLNRARRWLLALFAFVWALSFPALASAAGRTAHHRAAPRASASTAKKAKPAHATTGKRAAGKASTRKASRRRRHRRHTHPTWLTPTFVELNGEGDAIEGDDPVVRTAALGALGSHNGTVVVVDPTSGRILTAINQGMAFTRGFQPCSTFKPIVGLGALAEGVVTRDTPVRITRRVQMNLTEALATSNNNYFQIVGMRLGFPKLHAYASLFGVGERATLVEREQPGTLTAVPPANGGVGFMSSHGEGIAFTAVQLAALTTAIANGGTLYYLQYPRTPFEAGTLAPRIKRQIALGEWIPDIKPGMMAATEFGTARRAALSADEPILGKTGTCTDRQSPTHLGWFASFNESSTRKLVVVVLLTGGAGVRGPEAAAVGGEIYRRLAANQYVAQGTNTVSFAGE
jgi:penicillin-binding protein 2